jgi:hypothetical protein
MGCKNCIHESVCSALIEKGLPWNDGEYPAEAFCMAFRNKADVAEIVRCKDCIYSFMSITGETVLYCDMYPSDDHLGWDKDHYCSYGDRKDNYKAYL